MQKFKFVAPKNYDLPNIRFEDDEENIGFVRQPPNYQVFIQSRN